MRFFSKKPGLLIGLLCAFFAFASNVSASELSMQASPSAVHIGDRVAVDLTLSAGKDAVNAVGAKIIFSPEYLHVVSLEKTGSALTFWAEEPQYDNAAGLISFAGGVPGAGFMTSNEHLLRATFVAQQSGTTTIGYSPVSSALLADGLGTADQVARRSIVINIRSKNHPSDYAVLLIDGLGLLLLFLILYRIHRCHVKSRLSQKPPYNKMSIALLALLLFCIFSTNAHASTEHAWLTVEPASAALRVGREQQATIYLNNPDKLPVNAVEAHLIFDPKILHASLPAQNSSALTFWAVAPTVDMAAGTIAFAGGAVTPLSAPRSVLLRLTLIPETVAEKTSISLHGSQVLIADGKGTDVTGPSRDAIWSIGTTAPSATALPTVSSKEIQTNKVLLCPLNTQVPVCSQPREVTTVSPLSASLIIWLLAGINLALMLLVIIHLVSRYWQRTKHKK